MNQRSSVAQAGGRREEVGAECGSGARREGERRGAPGRNHIPPFGVSARSSCWLISEMDYDTFLVGFSEPAYIKGLTQGTFNKWDRKLRPAEGADMAEAEAPRVFLVRFGAPRVCQVPGTPEAPSGRCRRPRALTAKTRPCCLLAVWESRAPWAPLANGEHGNRASEAVRSQYARAQAADMAGEPAPSSPHSRSRTPRPPAARACTPLVSPGHRGMPCPCVGHAAKRLAPLSPGQRQEPEHTDPASFLLRWCNSGVYYEPSGAPGRIEASRFLSRATCSLLQFGLPSMPCLICSPPTAASQAPPSNSARALESLSPGLLLGIPI